jgi:hypothetical protein
MMPAGLAKVKPSTKRESLSESNSSVSVARNLSAGANAFSITTVQIPRSDNSESILRGPREFFTNTGNDRALARSLQFAFTKWQEYDFFH